VDSADDIPPEKMEQVWLEHTACAVRPPWILNSFRLDKFEIGKTIITPIVAEGFSVIELATCMQRHRYGDWGDVCREDKEANDLALEDGSRLLYAYKFKDGRVLRIITEAKDDTGKRRSTTSLLPEDFPTINSNHQTNTVIQNARAEI